METVLDNGSEPESFARIGGYFYNINDSGGATGDIFAQIKIGDRGNGGLEAFWYVDQRLTDDGSEWQELGIGTLIGPGTLQYNTSYQVKLSYDGNSTFSFTVNGNTDGFTGPVKKREAVTSFKALSSGINATNGSDNGFVSAKFDNVYINDQATLYEDFSSSPLDSGKWRSLEE